MNDLEKAIAQKEAQIAVLADEIATLKRSLNILKGSSAPSTPRPIVRRRRGGLTMGDAAEHILRHEGGPLHVDLIMSKLAGQGINQAKATVVSGLLKDRRKRFKLIGGNVFDLAERVEDIPVVNVNGNGSSTQQTHIDHLLPLTLYTPGTRVIKRDMPKGFSLKGAIKELLPKLQGEISQPVVYRYLQALYPEAATTIKRASIATTLRVLAEDGLIEMDEKGHGGEPHKYKMVEKQEMSMG